MAVQHSHFMSRRAALLLGLWLSCAALLAQDTVWVRGAITPGPDSLAISVEWRMGGQSPAPGLDSMWMPVDRMQPLLCWGQGDLGRAQLEAAWPRFADSVHVALFPDSAGLTLTLGADTLLQAWSPAHEGCFPATSKAVLTAWLDEQAAIPFERRRHDAAMAWLKGHCLTVGDLGRLLDSFDDESRRLSLIQQASVVRPAELNALSNRFFSAHYKSAFQRWLPEEN